MKNIVITGFMATGKSTVGSELSRMIGAKFIDTDAEIEKREKLSISEIFEKYGEQYFRDIESETALRLSRCENIIIATGGGMVLRKSNIENLRKNGIIFLLDADFADIESHMNPAGSGRPLMDNASREDILKRFLSRAEFYDNCDYRIKIKNKSPYMIAKEISAVYELVK